MCAGSFGVNPAARRDRRLADGGHDGAGRGALLHEVPGASREERA